MTSKLDPKHTTLREAVRLLGHLGSANDPIFLKGKETTPADLACRMPNQCINRIRIGYFAAGLRHVTNGTFGGMIHDRGGAAKAEENSRLPHIGGYTRGN